MNPKLNDNIISSEDLKDIIEELKIFLTNYRHQKVKNKILKKSLDTKVPDFNNLTVESIRIIRTFLNQKDMSESNIDQLIHQLEKYLDQCLKIRITLADIPTLSVKKSLVSWCRENVSENILIDFRFNRYILGGMVVSFKSHTYDWSFRQKIIANQDKLYEVIQSV